ncbi:transcriptional activator ChrR [Alginatibacterium sediminis]|uniref:Transcriptional activator ChrR n=1 Tax=Alginatibacterium sediminis TaxID=2164068 RepID=A0A420ECS2_9ALTE|nr:ChrR family anti-sigma-E factor [Alginatibacterium sediminis]RKF18461.1 transcriptional activator ChrR [Alginatibacterium sediminis]
MKKCNHHPSQDLLRLHASGDADLALSIIVSAHLDFCPQCRDKIADIEQQNAEQMLLQPETEMPNFESMMSGILQQQQIATSPETKPSSAQIVLEGRCFDLPRVLSRHQQRIEAWRRIPGKLHRAKIPAAVNGQLDLLHMDTQAQLPEHTHKGQEYTLVLHGEFSDDNGVYSAGDLLVKGPNDSHQPRTNTTQDCLCLTYLDAPLHFKSGLASLLNPFSQYFFDKN